jgi:3,4-dihydroxy 2-butanone 4-phosphate synthase
MLEEALSALRAGGMVLLHDASGREDEVDMVVPAPAVRPQTILSMRAHGGGLICLAIGGGFARTLDLPYMTDLMSHSTPTVKAMVPERTAYGDKPAFSLSINHRKTYTGVTDNDRALTITEFAKLEHGKEFAENFYAPGHIHLLIAKTLAERRGHTELSTELARRAGLKETMVLCEMMADDHEALTPEDAQKYADERGLILLDGGEL